MKKNNIKAIAFDMDGTLLTDEKKITPRTRRCFKALEERGISLVLSTGRSFEALEPYKIDLDLNHPVICYNGAQVLGEDGEIIQNHFMYDDSARSIIDFGRKEGVHVQLYKDSILYFERKTPAGDFYERHVSLKGELVNFDDLDPLNATKVMYVGDHDYLAGLEKAFQEQSVENLSTMFSNPMFLEFVDIKVSKGNALSDLAGYLGIETDNIMSFGDGQNDISMIEVAGIGVGMENATEELKAVSDYTTLNNNQDGVAVFLEDYFELEV